MKKSWIIVFLVFIVIIISAFVFILNKRFLVEKVPTIILNKEEFQKGDGVIAKIIFPSVNYYVESCYSPLFNLYFLDENKKWVKKTINQENSECSPYCKNNISLVDGGCQQKWSIGQSICSCDKLNSRSVQADGYFTQFDWDLNFYEYENKTCGNEKGVFKFVKPAPSGQYKVQYTYFDDKECKFKNSAEKIFVIK